MKRILVIEDDPKHLNDAKEFFRQVENVKVTFVEDYQSAIGETAYLDETQRTTLEDYDGIISDIFFPLIKSHGKWGQPEPIGVAIMMLCERLKLPCILNTAGYHHGSRYQWICSLQRRFDLPEIVDATKDHFEDAESKNWGTAFRMLSTLIK